MNAPAALMGCLLMAHVAQAEGVRPEDYATLEAELTARVDFERLPQRAEPGFNLDMPLFAQGAWLGERFHGQTLAAHTGVHDAIAGDPSGPWLRIAGGAAKQNLSIAFHRGFGSNAVFPLGTDGFPRLTARGEGALAILFDTDQRAVGFRLHSDYPAPLGAQTSQAGTVEVYFFARDGQLIGTHIHAPRPGISEHGYRVAPQHPAIAGMLMLNTDPGGVAYDDIIFSRPGLLG